MATSNGSSPTKVEVYESLYVICQATEQIIQHVRRLESPRVLSRNSMALNTMAAYQLRGEIAAAAVLNLALPEADNACHHQSQRIRLERKLAQIKPKSRLKTK